MGPIQRLDLDRGATYKNYFKLPHAEAQTVAKLLTSAGLDKQNGGEGTLVPHVTSGKLADQAATIQPVLAAPCGPASNGIASITSPWASVTCGATGTFAQPTAGKASRAALLSADGAIGLAQLQFDKRRSCCREETGTGDPRVEPSRVIWSSILRAPCCSTPAWEASPGWISAIASDGPA